MLFVFAALGEFVVVKVLDQHAKMRHEERHSNASNVTNKQRDNVIYSVL